MQAVNAEGAGLEATMEQLTDEIATLTTEIAKRKGEFKNYFYTPALQAITQDKDNKAAVVQVLEAVEEMGEDADADDILYSLEQCGDGFELATPSDVLSQS